MFENMYSKWFNKQMYDILMNKLISFSLPWKHFAQVIFFSVQKDHVDFNKLAGKRSVLKMPIHSRQAKNKIIFLKS